MANELKPLPNELYQFYPSMSAQTHEAHVKAYAKSHMKEDTRPAAPVEGLVRYESTGTTMVLEEHKNGEYVLFSQAEAIIAAKEQERNDSSKAWRDAFDSMHRRAMDAEADNAALTARVKHFEDAIKAKGGNEHSPTQDAYDLACKAIDTHRNRAEALETQLVAAEDIRKELQAELQGCEAENNAKDTELETLKYQLRQVRLAQEREERDAKP